MFKRLRFRRFLGLIAVILGVAALAIAAESTPPPGACVLEDAGWRTWEGGCQDQVSGLVWSANFSALYGYDLNWFQATDYCQNLVEGGKDDWRLARPAEVTTAFQHDVFGIKVDPVYPWTARHLSSIYSGTWTSQQKGNKATYGWLHTGVLESLLKKQPIYTYCVRQGATVAPPLP